MKSPFHVVQNFLSPLQCEKIVDDVRVQEPDRDNRGDAIKMERYSLFWEEDIRERFVTLIPDLEERYGCTYRGLEKPMFQYYPENAKHPAEGHGCENAKYIRKKWVQHKDVDLVGFIWLKDYQATVPLDPRHEVLGGKLEFPAYNFSLVPQRGTLIIFPAGPHFITCISPIMLGDLYQVKLNICVTDNGGRWFYQPANFPGKWSDWFEGHF